MGRNPDTFNSYSVLGDDICIWDDEVAMQYCGIMRLLGVSINQTKSYVSKHCAEFAKSLFVDGMNLSPIPLELIGLRVEYYYQDIMLLLEELCIREVSLTFSGYTRAVLFKKPWNIRPDYVYAMLTNPCSRYSWYLTTNGAFALWDQFGRGYVEFLIASSRILSFNLKEALGLLQSDETTSRYRKLGVSGHPVFSLGSKMMKDTLPLWTIPNKA